LEAFAAATPGRYLPLSDEALGLAAQLWANARQQVVVTTSNTKHLSQFITAQNWNDIQR
jgi:hypothetical protein